MKHLQTFTIQNASTANNLPANNRIKKWANAALQDGTETAEVTFRFVSAEEGQALNREYRGKDYATNVLTFTFDDMPEVHGLPLMGDIVLCVPVVEREAAEQKIAREAHYCHLIVHGMLHLQGYDHLIEDEAEKMESLEASILAKLGFANPYAEDQVNSDQSPLHDKPI